MANVAVVCHSCSNEVSGPQISCQGYCNAVFHLQCSGVPENVLAAITDYRQIFWMCRACTNLMMDTRHRKSAASAFESGQESVMSTQKRMVDDLKGEILIELKAEIRSHIATLITSNSLMPRSAPRNRPGAKPDLRKRLFDNKVDPEKQSQPLLQGTGKPASPSFCSTLVAASSSKFWLYITRVARTVTVDQVTKLAVERLGTEDVEVTRLVAKGKDVSTMSFISFKIGMVPALKEKALSTSTWPSGLIFREFEDRTTDFFWEPKESTSVIPKNPTGDGAKKSVTNSTPPNLPAAGNGTESQKSGVESMEE